MNNDHITDLPVSAATDARVDAMARSAGNELRRPAPENGLTRVHRVRRTQQVTRAALGGTAALALVAVGFLAVNRRKDDVTPADSVPVTEPQASAPVTVAPPPTADPSTQVPVPTLAAEPTPSAPGTAPAELPEPTSETTAPGPAGASPAAGSLGAPSVIYASSDFESYDNSRTMSLLDPLTGKVTSTEPVDIQRSQEAQAARYRPRRTSADLGSVGYDFTEATWESDTFNFDLNPNTDLCSQNIVTVKAPAGSTLPARARELAIGDDDRFVVTLSAACPEPGIMDERGIGTSTPFEKVLTVFDAQHPERPGRALASYWSDLLKGSSTLPWGDDVKLSGNGRFAAVSTLTGAVAGVNGYDVFDLETGERLDSGVRCTTNHVSGARFVGPWAGASTLVTIDRCADGQTLMMRDVATGEELRVPVPASDGLVYIEIDYAHFTTPSDAWFTICAPQAKKCSIGHGSTLTEIDATEAAFVPVGFYPGG